MHLTDKERKSNMIFLSFYFLLDTDENMSKKMTQIRQYFKKILFTYNIIPITVIFFSIKLTYKKNINYLSTLIKYKFHSFKNI